MFLDTEHVRNSLLICKPKQAVTTQNARSQIDEDPKQGTRGSPSIYLSNVTVSNTMVSQISRGLVQRTRVMQLWPLLYLLRFACIFAGSFGWLALHLYDFAVLFPNYDLPCVYKVPSELVWQASVDAATACEGHARGVRGEGGGYIKRLLPVNQPL